MHRFLFLLFRTLPLSQFQVQVLVLAGRLLPGDVLGHIPLDHLVPMVTVVEVKRLGPVDGVQQQAGVIPVKGEAVALAIELVVGLYGILQSAGLTNDGQGASRTMGRVP